MIETMGILAVVMMVTCYALEERAPVVTLLFAGSCTVAALYAFLIGSYPFMIAEGVWAIVAFRKWYIGARQKRKHHRKAMCFEWNKARHRQRRT